MTPRAIEVLVAGVTDNTEIERERAVWITAVAVFAFAIPPMINMRIFVPWDLTFGSGFQTLGALISVIAVGWFIDRSNVIKQLSDPSAVPDPPAAPMAPETSTAAARATGSAAPVWLYYWMRFVIPGAISAVGIWWLLTDVLGT